MNAPTNTLCNIMPYDGKCDVEKCISEEKMRKKTKEYQIFVLKDIFSEYELKEYINDIERIVQRMRDTIIAPTGKASITAITGAKNLGNRLEITRRSKRYQTRSIHSFQFL